MTDKVELIKSYTERRIQECKDMKIDSSYYDGLVFAFEELLSFTNSLLEEPVSNDLEKAAKEYADNAYSHAVDRNVGKADFIVGANWQKKHLWKPADGDDLPEYEREVVVFTQIFPDDTEMMGVAIGHRPNPNGWDGKSLSTGKVEHYTPKTYDKGGWNIPNVKYWLDVKLPKEIEL